MWPFGGLSGLGGVEFDLSDFVGKTSDQGFATATYSLQLRLKTNGDIAVYRGQGPDQDPAGTYVSPAAAAANTWARLTVQSGESPDAGSDAINTWLQLTSLRQWILVHTSGGGNDLIEGGWLLELATDSGGSNVVASQALTIIVGETF